MQRRIVLIALVIAAGAALAVWRLGGDHRAKYFTGFVEGEERIIRSEVEGRVLEVVFSEGAQVEPGAVIARLDDADMQTRLAAKRQELAVTDADIARQSEQIRLTENTWKRDVGAREAELHEAEAAADLAEKTYQREQQLVATGASTAQLLDDTRSRRDQGRSSLVRAQQMYARTAAEEGAIAVARHQLEVLRQRRELSQKELAQLEVTAAKYQIHAPPVPTVVQTQYIWPGELAQPGTPILSLLDPRDKYVQVYVPVAEVDRFRPGRPVAIELDSQPGRRYAGEVSFLAEKANFTPEKIETRSDRMGQVYRAKVRILEDVEQFQPGTEGNVYLVKELPRAILDKQKAAAADSGAPASGGTEAKEGSAQ